MSTFTHQYVYTIHIVILDAGLRIESVSQNNVWVIMAYRQEQRQVTLFHLVLSLAGKPTLGREALLTPRG